MYHFEYVSKKEAAPYKAELIEILHQVQDYVRDDFTFQFTFIGSSSRNMITYDPTTNIGFDFDVNITVNDDDEDYSPEEIRTILHNAFSRFMTAYGYNKCEQSTRVISIKVVDQWSSRVIRSCDFAVVYEGRNGQQYIRFNKERNYFSWEFQTQPYKELEFRADYLKENGHWNEVLEVYLDKKNNNYNPDKHSRSLYAETINECFRRHNNHE
ncbi:MAG: hypothetical protein SPJ40_03000 [Oscillospiraceae bacterium]|mgnify:FL=1|nr:hypothetical protein [Oscillospiraceae bacterium]